ncbi:hypothetical protein [Acetobacter persici]|uniref:Uncharacterized protein n=1 Tax=Acetobacter persici TaxID=1076596 RepID=A0A1U9LJ03_9PROT|nr:hypothetical protein [Acetobacter persici]AQT06270.1 hypothetical protein A0U91_14685 [Acetobacter persici]
MKAAIVDPVFDGVSLVPSQQGLCPDDLLTSPLRGGRTGEDMPIKAFKFTGALAAIQASKLVDAGASFLAGLDPQSATEADIQAAENHYTQALTKRAEARKAYDEANAVSAEDKTAYDREVAGLKTLAEKASKAEDAQEKTRLSGKVDAFEAELASKKWKVQSLIAATVAKNKSWTRMTRLSLRLYRSFKPFGIAGSELLTA